MRVKSAKLLLPFLFLMGGFANAAEFCVCSVCPHQTLQAALIAAALMAAEDVILLEQDIYTGNFTYNTGTGGSLTIRGGYKDSSLGNYCPNRDLNPANTILDGNAGGSTFTVLMGGETLTLEGLTIRNGSSSNFGSGLTVTGPHAIVQLDDMILSDNTTDAASVVTETVGGMYVFGADSVAISRSSFLRNTGGSTGGLRVIGTADAPFSLTLLSNTFKDNVGDVQRGDAGGAYLAIPPNQSETGGSSALLENNVFESNDGFISGALNLLNSDSTGDGASVLHNTFDSNSAVANGGMWAIGYASLVMTDNVFINNMTNDGPPIPGGPFYGGGLSVSLLDDGGGSPGNLTFTNNSLSGNTSSSGVGGLYVDFADGTSAELYNNILYGNVSTNSFDEFFLAQQFSGGVAPTVNLFNNGYDHGTIDGWGSSLTVAINQANNVDLMGIDLDAIFVHPPANLHLRADAVVIDVGDNNAPALSLFDRDFTDRIYDNGIVDMGAYEWQPRVDTDDDGVPDVFDNCIMVANSDQRDTDGDDIGNICDADVDGEANCFVNFLDLLVYRVNFFQPGDLDTDNNGDNFTNFTDLNVIRSYFFQQPGPSAAGCN